LRQWKKIFLYSTAPRQVLGINQHPIQWLPGAKQPSPKADHSPPSGAEFKKAGAIPDSLLRLYGVLLNKLSTGTNLTLPFMIASTPFSITKNYTRKI
jgi:hypothetical protein